MSSADIAFTIIVCTIVLAIAAVRIARIFKDNFKDELS